MDYMSYIWLGVIVAGVVLEAITVQLVSIWFVLGALAALLCSLLTDYVGIQLAVFAVVTLVSLIFTRPLVQRKIHSKAECTNADRAIGQTALVTEEINNEIGTGMVNVSGQIWTARAVDQSVIPAGTNVVVQSIQGVKLMVLPVSPQPGCGSASAV